ncbi:hypothetical protein EVG20_g4907 [Dentipellis fragilis]|uniref:Deoxyribonuclease NucA/NucB domain-containing protein n=1 Tax=Dentipellis fragilis TaxID=205917 RepID=A0A4Y9YVD9_9AGAM|nr:hypothetical protein EVG20_g4907 [Dentipellis fragilis]
MLSSRLVVLFVASFTAVPVLSTPTGEHYNEVEYYGKTARDLPPEAFGVTSRQATCDPCDDSCDTGTGASSASRRDEPEDDIRVVYRNGTDPWLPGEFDCTATTTIPDVCQNMCYGVNYRSHPTTLTKNSVTSSCAAARRQNSCGVTNPNRCSTRYNPPYPSGNSCDEYPFASTVEGQRAGTGNNIAAVTRCVVSGQNSAQGGKISGIYRRVPQGGQFEVGFSGPGGVGTGYCAPPSPNSCALSGSQQNN